MEQWLIVTTAANPRPRAIILEADGLYCVPQPGGWCSCGRNLQDGVTVRPAHNRKERGIIWDAAARMTRVAYRLNALYNVAKLRESMVNT